MSEEPQPQSSRVEPESKAKDRETKPGLHRVAKEAMLSLRGAVSDEAISVCGQRLLRSARTDALTVFHAIGVLSLSPKQIASYLRLQLQDVIDMQDLMRRFQASVEEFQQAFLLLEQPPRH